MLFLFSFLFLFICFFLGVLLLHFYFYSSILVEFFLFSFSGLDVCLSFVFDFLSMSFFCCVSFISFVVFVYTKFYMHGTVDMRRFLWLVFLFVMSMFILVFSGNFFMIMVGWDGLGLVSFFLVIFYSNSTSLESGLVTVFSNRVGDVFFLMSFLFFFMGGVLTWDLGGMMTGVMFCLFIFMGAITKSAQVPFSAWLPAAMAAPTPVSSLVHSSTLVTAGVYVLIRFNYVFGYFSHSILKLTFLFTMILAGASASLEKDFKKIVAMSTLSQLGMMMFILSVGSWFLSFLHMIIHAFFKSMLFLSTGSFMGQMSGSQDSRLYGSGLFSYTSFLYFLVSGVCLSGFPFFIGFYSKDFIISSCSFYEGIFIYYMFILGCVFTVSYSVRLIYESFYSLNKYLCYYSFNESIVFIIPVSFLFMFCSLLGGYFYLYFISNSVIYFSLFDVLTGLSLMFVGIFMFNVIKYFYFLYLNLAFIMFYRWKSSGGSSFLFSNIPFHYFESTWVEKMGGGGTFLTMSKLNKTIDHFNGIGLGSLIFVFMMLTIYLL